MSETDDQNHRTVNIPGFQPAFTLSIIGLLTGALVLVSGAPELGIVLLTVSGIALVSLVATMAALSLLVRGVRRASEAVSEEVSD